MLRGERRAIPSSWRTLPAGGDVAALLNSLFSSRVIDPAQRQQLVDQVIRDRGLPGTLSGPVTLYTQQITLQERANVTFGLLGARNSIFFSASYLRSEPIAGSGDPLPPALAGANDNTQYGRKHRLQPSIDAADQHGCEPVVVPDRAERADPASRRDRESRDDEPDYVARVLQLAAFRRIPPSSAACAIRCRRPTFRSTSTTKPRSSRDSGTRFVSCNHVRILLRADRQAVPAQPRSRVLLRQPRAQARVRLPRVRPVPERGLHRHHRRDRRRQDDDRAQPARAARSRQGRRGAARQHAARRRRHAALGRRRVRPAGARRSTRRSCWRRSRRSCASWRASRSARCSSSTRRRTSRRGRSRSCACCRTSSSATRRCCRASWSASRSCARSCRARRCSSCASA